MGSIIFSGNKRDSVLSGLTMGDRHGGPTAMATVLDDVIDTAGGDQNATLTQLIADTHLAMRRLLDGIGNNGVFGFFINPVFQVRHPPGLLQKRFDDALFNSIASNGKTCLATAPSPDRPLRHCPAPRPSSKDRLCTDDFLITLQHDGASNMVLMLWFATSSKLVTLASFKKRCQIKSELLQFTAALSKIAEIMLGS